MAGATAVAIREVGPRDGFQNEPETIATADKIRLIEALGAAGLPRIELTSFVRADVIPQLADAAEVLTGASLPEATRRSVLIPNMRGLELALEQRDRFDEINVFVSATETHNQRNVRRSIEQSLADLEQVVAHGCAENLHCEAVIVVAFGCPYEGVVDRERVFEMASRLAAAGVVEVAFGDTIGIANPAQVGEFFAAARDALGGIELTAHFHDTYGRALANAYAAWDAGCATYESSLAGLGGSPLTPGATGNVCSEDLVAMFETMGVDTGIDQPKLIAAAADAQSLLGRPLPSHTLAAHPKP